MTDNFEQFLDSRFDQYHYSSGEPTFRAWLADVLFETLDMKRAAGCDSGWQYSVYEALAIIDPRVADVDVVARIAAANVAEDGETADDLRDALKVDEDAAIAAFRKLIDYILAPR